MDKKEGWHKLDYHQRGEYIAELQALLTRVLVGGNARLPTQLLVDIRTALGDD